MESPRFLHLSKKTNKTMFSNKFDLYRHGWLELVFEGRNKSYGAYELRQHNDRRLAKALGFGFLLFSALFGAAYFNMNREDIVKPDETLKISEFNLTKIIIPEGKKVELPKSVEQQKPAPKLETKKFVAPKVVPDNLATEPPNIHDLKDIQIGSEDIVGKMGKEASAVTINSGTGEGTTPVADDGIRTVGTVEKMPEFAGGFTAWAKFLQKTYAIHLTLLTTASPEKYL